MNGYLQTELTNIETAIIDMALERYEQQADGWNEEELKMNFISHILSVANPNITSVCKIFFERPLSGIVGKYELNVITDCFVASYDEAGLPLNPYFFLQMRNAARFKQSQRFGKSDGSGRPPTRPDVGRHVIGRNGVPSTKKYRYKYSALWLLCD